jgi:hypothetical protein
MHECAHICIHGVMQWVDNTVGVRGRMEADPERVCTYVCMCLYIYVYIYIYILYVCIHGVMQWVHNIHTYTHSYTHRNSKTKRGSCEI